MVNEETLSAILGVVYDAVNPASVMWRLEGSVNLYVQGMEVPIEDVEIVIDEIAAETFKNTLVDYFREDYFDKEINARVLVFDIMGTDVEFLIYHDPEFKMLAEAETLTWKDMDIAILPLQKARIIYERIGKTERVNQIDHFLNSRLSGPNSS